jgi:tellurite resistance protein TerC
MMSVLVFLILAIGPLLLDMHYRKPEREPLARAIKWSLVYVASAMAFALWLFLIDGADRSVLFLSAYTIEKAMSMDNLIIFGTIFAYFGVRPEHEYRVLHWGIVGSAVLRLLFIAAGLTLAWVFGRFLDVAFGLFVLWTAWKIMGGGGEESIDHNKRWYIRWTRHFFPVSAEMTGKFFVRSKHGMPLATPLFFCLIALEFTDIAFAFDSIPAVIGLTKSTLIAYTAVMFAVLGLRSMYFVLEAMKRYTESMGRAVMFVLIFVGAKMMIHGIIGFDIPASATLAVILACLGYGVMDSVIHKSKEPKEVL